MTTPSSSSRRTSQGSIPDARQPPPLTTQQITNDPIMGSIIPGPRSPSSPTTSSPSRALSSTLDWKPSTEDKTRRQSWSAQEYLHQFHSKLAEDHDLSQNGRGWGGIVSQLGKTGTTQGQGGFTERG
ncbi:hypothetical protein QBC43DRAFT_283602 [Cladorrhinum sp. PSN259]|nr:hypothetical protein QBC43DRAFT_283602 [Cladorrhinum sp. PSN259]